MHPDLDCRERQSKYFAALKTLPKVTIILGVFQNREVTCRAHCKQKYGVPEEKKTDVNLAVEMMSDSIAGNCENLYVVSGDSDIQPPVEWISKNKPGLKVTVYVPCLANEQANRRMDYFQTKRLNVKCLFLPLTEFHNHQLPHNVKLPDGKFSCRPACWI